MRPRKLFNPGITVGVGQMGADLHAQRDRMDRAEPNADRLSCTAAAAGSGCTAAER